MRRWRGLAASEQAGWCSQEPRNHRVDADEELSRYDSWRDCALATPTVAKGGGCCSCASVSGHVQGTLKYGLDSERNGRVGRDGGRVLKSFESCKSCESGKQE